MEVLNNKLIINKGIFNNIDVMENTLESFNEALRRNCILRFEIKYLKDGNIIIFDESALKRLFNLKDNINEYVYEDLEYISTYKVPKLNEIINIIPMNSFIYISDYSKKNLKLICKELDDIKNDIIIESSSIKVLKFFRKNGYRVSLFIKKKNKRNINAFFKPDIYNLELSLFDNKFIKKLREKYYVIGSLVCDENSLKENKNIYDNLVMEIME